MEIARVGRIYDGLLERQNMVCVIMFCWQGLLWLLCDSDTGAFLYNPGALFRKSLSNNIDILNSTPGVVCGKLQ